MFSDLVAGCSALECSKATQEICKALSGGLRGACHAEFATELCQHQSGLSTSKLTPSQ